MVFVMNVGDKYIMDRKYYLKELLNKRYEFLTESKYYDNIIFIAVLNSSIFDDGDDTTKRYRIITIDTLSDLLQCETDDDVYDHDTDTEIISLKRFIYNLKIGDPESILLLSLLDEDIIYKNEVWDSIKDYLKEVYSKRNFIYNAQSLLSIKLSDNKFYGYLLHYLNEYAYSSEEIFSYKKGIIENIDIKEEVIKLMDAYDTNNGISPVILGDNADFALEKVFSIFEKFIVERNFTKFDLLKEIGDEQ